MKYVIRINGERHYATKNQSTFINVYMGVCIAFDSVFVKYDEQQKKNADETIMDIRTH